MSKYVTTMTIYDSEHYTDEEKEMIIAGYEEHERDARAFGKPVLGSGAVFPVTEKEFVVEPFEIPSFWPRIAGHDFGWDHPAGTAWLAHDTDNDIIYVYDAHKKSKGLIPVLASTIKSRGNWIPVAWPHDGHQVKDAMHGQQLAKQYKAEGVNMLKTHAQFKRDKNDESKTSVVSLEAGIQDMLTRLQTGRWKVFSTCEPWLEEYRIYHRKDGVIQKIYDDVICASRYAYMMIRYAEIYTSNVPQQLRATWVPSDPGMGY